MPATFTPRPRTAWRERVSVLADASGVSVDGLGELVEAEVARVEGLLFTATPAEDLDEISRWQRLADAAWCGQVRSIVAAWNRATETEREFLGSEVSLALAITDAAAQDLICFALLAAELPGLVEAVETGMLTVKHAYAASSALSSCGLALDAQCAVLLLALARYQRQTPGELGRLIEKLAQQLDPDCLRERAERARAERSVSTRALPDGLGLLTAVGPLEMVEAIRAALAAGAAAVSEGDDRTRDQREFDLLHDLVTGSGSAAGGGWTATIVMTADTAAGGDTELAEIPGRGGVQPSVAREVLGSCMTVTRVVLNGDGQVVEVSPLLPGPAASATDTSTWLRDLEQRPVLHGPPSATAAYRPGPVMRRYVIARDRTCTFPGCSRPAATSDLDHLLAWPLGPTDPHNLHALCRRHHRAKQAVFTLVRLHDGTTRWITRGGWWFDRPPQGY